MFRILARHGLAKIPNMPPKRTKKGTIKFTVPKFGQNSGDIFFYLRLPDSNQLCGARDEEIGTTQQPVEKLVKEISFEQFITASVINVVAKVV